MYYLTRIFCEVGWGWCVLLGAYIALRLVRERRERARKFEQRGFDVIAAPLDRDPAEANSPESSRS